jgi:hypothetical protein
MSKNFLQIVYDIDLASKASSMKNSIEVNKTRRTNGATTTFPSACNEMMPEQQSVNEKPKMQSLSAKKSLESYTGDDERKKEKS